MFVYIYICVCVDIQTLFAKVSTGFNIPNQHLYPWDHRGTVNGAIDSFDKAELVLFKWPWSRFIGGTCHIKKAYF